MKRLLPDEILKLLLRRRERNAFHIQMAVLTKGIAALE